MLGCVDLAKEYGQSFRVQYEEQAPLWPKEDRPWLAELVCTGGVIYPHGGDVLVARISCIRLATKLAKSPVAESVRRFGVTAGGTTRALITFRHRDGGTVFKILRPKRKRRGGRPPISHFIPRLARAEKRDMVWNYRIIKEPSGGFAVHEVYYYRNSSSPRTMTAAPIGPRGATVKEVRRKMKRLKEYRADAQRPVFAVPARWGS